LDVGRAVRRGGCLPACRRRDRNKEKQGRRPGRAGRRGTRRSEAGGVDEKTRKAWQHPPHPTPFKDGRGKEQSAQDFWPIGEVSFIKNRSGNSAKIVNNQNLVMAFRSTNSR